LIREPHQSDEDIDRAVAEIVASGESAGPVPTSARGKVIDRWPDALRSAG